MFRDLDDPARYVFLRGCPDLDARQRILTAFYSDGEMWRANRDEINSWLVDSDNVLLARPVSELAPPATGASTVGMYTHVRRTPLAPPEAEVLQRQVTAAIAGSGGRLLVTFATDPAENNYPRHPIRTGEHGLISFASFATTPHVAVPDVVERRLAPTATSRMR